MTKSHVVNVDLAKVYLEEDGGRPQYLTTLGWGDPVEVLATRDDVVVVAATSFERQDDGSVKSFPVEGIIKRGLASDVAAHEVVVPIEDSPVLKVDFVDVQQGDGSVIETPAGQVMLIDGGDNQLFARFLANRFRSTSDSAPKEIDAIVITHGDADHFSGLTEIHESEGHSTEYKRFFMQPRRVFHNGLVKRPSQRAGKRVPDDELLGPTIEVDGETFIVGLEEDLLEVSDEEMNEPFKRWKAALVAYAAREAIEFRALAFGDDDAFDFLSDEDIQVEVLGPLRRKLPKGEGLPFLGTPHPTAHLGEQPVRPARFVGKSASHTINGHSVILRMTYGKVTLLFSGDLNEQAAEALVAAHEGDEISLRSDVLKAPHHGSADFSADFLKAVEPVVSVISSGDESSLKEYIHPRATLMGALGKYSRQALAEPLIFVTELVAFFTVEGYVDPETHKMVRGKPIIEDGQVLTDPKAKESFFAFSRAAFGLVKIRTDGKRLLVWTNSGQTDLKEAYAFDFSSGDAVPVALRRV